jgi:hypothetical protein
MYLSVLLGATAGGEVVLAITAVSIQWSTSFLVFYTVL